MKKIPIKLNESSTRFSLWDYSISFIVKTGSVAENYHHCYKIIISLDNSFGCLIDGQALFGLKGMIVNQSIPYSYYAPETHFLVNFIEPNSFWGQQLRTLLKDNAWLNIDSVVAEEKISDILPLKYDTFSDEELSLYVTTFLDSIFHSRIPVTNVVTDERIKQVLEYIDYNLHESLRLEDIADYVNLSADRIRHLFVIQMHIPFSQYLLWRRIRKVMEATLNKESKMNEACFNYGFTDQSHFNKTFKRIFGLTPGLLIRDARFLL